MTATPDFAAMLKGDVSDWNTWRSANPDALVHVSRASLERVNLAGANLSKVFMMGADFAGASLAGANFSGAFLPNANFMNADLRSATFADAVLSGARFRAANLTGASLRSAILIGAEFVETNLDDADISHCHVYGASVWNIRGQPRDSRGIRISSPDESSLTVDDIEAAQFVHMLVNNRKIRGFIDTVARKMVLILGRFTDERKAVLDAIRGALRQYDYVPVIFDFDKPATRDLAETMRTLAHLSRFIIADISDPSSIPLEIQAVVPDLAVPLQPLICVGQSEFAMFGELRKKYSWVLPTLHYADVASLLAALPTHVIAPAEDKARSLERR